MEEAARLATAFLPALAQGQLSAELAELAELARPEGAAPQAVPAAAQGWPASKGKVRFISSQFSSQPAVHSPLGVSGQDYSLTPSL